MIRKFLIPILLFTFFTRAAFAQTDSLRARVERSLAFKKAHVGVAITGVARPGLCITVQFAGLLEYNGWDWTLGSEVVISSNGTLTQTPQTVGFSQVIGTPVTPTSIFINMQSPIVIP